MKLTVKQKGKIVGECYLTAEATTIGRGLNNDIVLEELRASREHAEVVKRDDKFFVRDKGSGNGTLLNDEKIEEAEINPGDRIGIGDVTIEVSAEEEAAREGTPVGEGMAGLLTIQGGPDDGTAFGLRDEENAIGRLPECAATLEDAKVSRRNTKITLSGERYLVEDLASGNGTRLNGVLLKEGQQVELVEGDVITAGDTDLKFSVVPESGLPASPEEPAEPQAETPPVPAAAAEAPAPAKKGGGAVAAVVVLLILAVGAYFAYRTFAGGSEIDEQGFEETKSGAAPSAGAAASDKVVPVDVAKPARRDLTHLLRFDGEVEATEGPAISSKLAERVRAVYVKNGGVVKKGDVLVKLEDKDHRTEANATKADLRKAAASLEEAKESVTDLARQMKQPKEHWESMTRLYKKRAVSKSEVDKAKQDYLRIEAKYNSARNNRKKAVAAVDSARQQLKAAEDKLAYTEIKAPIAGVVSALDLNAGQMVGVGRPFLRILQLKKVKVTVMISPRESRAVRIDVPATITVDEFPGKVFQGKVTKKAPVVDRRKGRKRKYTIEVPNPDRKLRPGHYPKVVIAVGTHKNALVVPRVALADREGKRVVFVVQVDTEKNVRSAMAVPVREGFLDKSDDSVIEVVPVTKGGLTEDSLVVVRGHEKLNGGEKVKIVAGR